MVDMIVYHGQFRSERYEFKEQVSLVVHQWTGTSVYPSSFPPVDSIAAACLASRVSVSALVKSLASSQVYGQDYF